LREKFSWYETLWSTGGDEHENLEEILTRNIPGLLDEQSKSNIKSHARQWSTIFKGVRICEEKKKKGHPGALRFLNLLEAKLPGLDDAQLSVYVGLTITLLNNVEHLGISGNEGLRLMNSPHKLSQALKRWDTLSDKEILGVVIAFQEATTAE